MLRVFRNSFYKPLNSLQIENSLLVLTKLEILSVCDIGRKLHNYKFLKIEVMDEFCGT